MGDLPIAYLCGQEDFCREVGSKEALGRAKRNVEQASNRAVSETHKWNVVLFLGYEAYMQVESFRAFVKVLLDVGCFVYLPNILCINISSHLSSFRELASFQKSWTLNFDWINIFWTHSLSKAYPVIGVMEHLDKSLRVFERRLPTFFGGIHDIYYRELKGVFFSFENWNINWC